jgi:hypothetical protein
VFEIVLKANFKIFKVSLYGRRLALDMLQRYITAELDFIAPFV